MSMANAKRNLSDVREVDPAIAQAAFETIRKRLDELPAETVTHPRTDLQAAALAGLALVDIARVPQRKARFDKLPADEFSPTTIDDLEQVCCAAWFVQTRVQAETADDGGPKVEAALYEDSGTHLDNLLKLLDYHVGTEVAAQLADIRSGTGYQDRASDLLRAATLFDTWEDELKADVRRYEASMAADARAYANAILAEIRASMTSAKTWTEMRDRCWTLLLDLYKDVEDTGQWLFRKEPREQQAFISLRRMVRLVRPPRKPKPPATPPPPAGATS